jgi:hypothetical protein
MSIRSIVSFIGHLWNPVDGRIGTTVRRPAILLILTLAVLAMSGMAAVSTVSAQSGSDASQQVSAPSEPQNFRAVVGDGHVTVGWRQPTDDGGSPITEYRLRYKRSGADNTWLPDEQGIAVTSPHAITGLLNEKEYTVEVWAVNAFAGAGETKRPASLTATPIYIFTNRWFPNLHSKKVIGPRTSQFNCIAWAAGDSNRWYDPKNYWPRHLRFSWGIDSLERLYGALGYEKADDGSIEPEYLKIALYKSKIDASWTHAAIQTPSGIWQSKLGWGELIEHLTPDDVAGGSYGEVAGFMRRRRDANLPPIFSEIREVRSVVENTAPGTPIGKPVTTNDPEGHTLVYGLLHTKKDYKLAGVPTTSAQATADAKHFTIDGVSGQLYTKGPLDYETKDLYKVVVAASDGNLLDSVVVVINVMDMQDEDASVPLSGTLNLSNSHQARIARADSQGTVLIRWRADDKASEDAYYRLRRRSVGEEDFQVIVKKIRDNGPNDADDAVGSLAYRDSGDALAPGQRYEYGMRTFYDAGGKSKWTRKESSLSAGSLVFTVPENSTAGRAIGVFAPDILTGGQLTYELDGPYAAYFSVDTNGRLRLRRALDFETRDSYELTIIATDSQKQSAVLNLIVMNAAKVPPGQPNAPTFGLVDERWFDLKWQEPNTGGTPITRIAFQIKRSSAPESAFGYISFSQPDDYLFTRSVRVSDYWMQRGYIIPGTSYDVRVREQNAAGWGPWSESATVTTDGDAPPDAVELPPGKPGRPNITRVYATSFRIEWQPPSLRGDSIVEMGIQYKLSSEPESAFVYVKPKPRYPRMKEFVRGFNLIARSGQSVLPDTSYDVRVQERNGAGWGEWSDVSTVTTAGTAPAADTPPGKPDAPTFSDVQETQFRVVWAAPTAGSSAITGYGIQYKLSSEADDAYADVSPAPRGGGKRGFNVVTRQGQFIIPGTSYDVRVREQNAEFRVVWAAPTAGSSATTPTPMSALRPAEEARGASMW